MKSRRRTFDGAPQRDRKQAKPQNQLSKIWSSVLKWFKSLLTAPKKDSKQPAKKKRKKAATMASGSNPSKRTGGRAPNSPVPPAKLPVSTNKRKGSPRRQFLPRRRSPAAYSFAPPRLHGPALIDRVLKNLHRNSGDIAGPGPRKSKLSRKSTSGPVSAKQALPEGKKNVDPVAALTQVNTEPVVKKLRGLLGGVNRIGGKQSDVLAKLLKRIGLTSDNAPQQADEHLSYVKTLQQTVAGVSSPANAMLGHAAKLLKENAIPQPVVPNQHHLPDHMLHAPVPPFPETTPPWEVAAAHSDSSHRDEPTGSSCGGWPTTTYSITDARFNNVPKRPLQPIR